MHRDVYPGIDVVYYGDKRRLEYDLIVAPGADATAYQAASKRTRFREHFRIRRSAACNAGGRSETEEAGGLSGAGRTIASMYLASSCRQSATYSIRFALDDTNYPRHRSDRPSRSLIGHRLLQSHFARRRCKQQIAEFGNARGIVSA